MTRENLKKLAEYYDEVDSLFSNLEDIDATEAANQADILRDKIWETFRDAAATIMYNDLLKRNS